jgi:hypothetical protein
MTTKATQEHKGVVKTNYFVLFDLCLSALFLANVFCLTGQTLSAAVSGESQDLSLRPAQRNFLAFLCVSFVPFVVKLLSFLRAFVVRFGLSAFIGGPIRTANKSATLFGVALCISDRELLTS